NVDNMEEKRTVPYLKGDNFQAISLDYYDGIEMDIFLPNKGINIDKFIQDISENNFSKWVKSFNSTEAILQIPKFKMQYETDLNDTLEALGMKQAFDKNKANFKNFANNPDENPMYISKVKHKAYISVDEKETEAAAVTAVVIGCTSAAPIEKPKPIEFKVDRPFFFAIRDAKTGTILFMGKVENPSID
ncbi:MAG: serpin family protein, partial [Clostridiaceae bacterium]|nr:serpin family protein [Clostridiaceae bacterium]